MRMRRRRIKRLKEVEEPGGKLSMRLRIEKTMNDIVPIRPS